MAPRLANGIIISYPWLIHRKCVFSLFVVVPGRGAALNYAPLLLFLLVVWQFPVRLADGIRARAFVMIGHEKRKALDPNRNVLDWLAA